MNAKTRFEWTDRDGRKRWQIVPTWSAKQYNNFYQDLLDIGATNIHTTTIE